METIAVEMLIAAAAVGDVAVAVVAVKVLPTRRSNLARGSIGTVVADENAAAAVRKPPSRLRNQLVQCPNDIVGGAVVYDYVGDDL